MISEKLNKFTGLFLRQFREQDSPITEKGINGEVTGDGCHGIRSANEFEGKKRTEPFAPSTVVVSNGQGVWKLEVQKDILKKLIDMTLKIETIRTHGMLHSPKKNKTASIFVNNILVDRIKLVKEHPHGKDFGVDSRRQIPIYQFIDKTKIIQTIKVEVEEGAFWDIDRITLEPILLNKEIKPAIAMVIGAMISGIIGSVISLLINLFN